MKMKNSYDLSKLKLLEKIGEGGFGKVYKVENKETGDIYAAKVSINEVDPDNQNEMLDLYREVSIISAVHHPSVLSFIGYSQTDFDSEPNPVIITEFSPNGSLDHLIKLSRNGANIDSFDDTKKLIILYGIAAGMSYLHSHQILHRDLKAANILVDERLCPKIADFGLSKIYHNQTTVVTPESTIDVKGTPMFIAPEIWKEQKYTEAGDVYAYAFIVYELIHGPIPPLNLNPIQLMDKVANKKYRPKIDLPIPKSYKKLIEDCWNQKEKKRPSFAEICERLTKDTGFITDKTDKSSFDDYCIFIDEAVKTYDRTKRVICFANIVNVNKKTFVQVQIPQKTYKKPRKKSICPESVSSKLDKDSKKLIEEAENDDDKQYVVGTNLIEGKNGFTKDVELGIKYLKTSLKNGNIEAAKYLSQVLLDGKILYPDPDKAIKYLNKFDKEKDGTVFNLLGKAYKQKNDSNNAATFFEKAAKAGNVEAMYEYGVCLFNGDGVPKDIEKGKSYFQMAKNNGYNLPQNHYSDKNQYKKGDDNNHYKGKNKYQQGKKTDDDDSNHYKGQNKHQQNKKTADDDDDDDSNHYKGPNKYQQNKKTDDNSNHYKGQSKYQQNKKTDDNSNHYKGQKKYQQNKKIDDDDDSNHYKGQNKYQQGKKTDDDSNHYKGQNKYQQNKKTDDDDSNHYKGQNKYQQGKKTDDNSNHYKGQNKYQQKGQDSSKYQKKYTPKKKDDDDDDDDSKASNGSQHFKPSKPTDSGKLDQIWDETNDILKKGSYTDDKGNNQDIGKKIKSSVENTVTYKPDDKFDLGDFFTKRGNYGNSEKGSIYKKIEVTNESTFSAAKRFKSNNIKEVCILNFASPSYPGNTVRHGRNQESFLCRRSSLIKNLQKDNEMYKYNADHQHPYFSNYLIYSPNIVVFRDDNDKLVPHFRVSAISSTPVNYTEILKNHPNGERFQNAYKTMKDRCRRIIELCIKTGNKVLILGAFGCGSSGNDPNSISKIFKELLIDEFYGMLLSNIVFAIKSVPNQKNDPFGAFKSRFGPKKG